uniref:LIM domain-containing protein n=1 Tax=Steinernema glaseri TaxID=37863 RepID=A0A1I8AAT1_9BILA
MVTTGYESAFCSRCTQGFESGEVFVKTDDRFYHNECFRCAQCFEMLHEQEHYSFDGRNYCSYDFKTLYAPKCVQCAEFIEGVVIRTSYGNWHPHCLTCAECNKSLQSKEGVYIVNGSNYCFDCKEKVGRQEHYYCVKCRQIVDADAVLRYKLEIYHPYHFRCVKCDIEVDETARVCGDDVYCLRCYDLEKSQICYACKVAIDYQLERSVVALDRHYHPK